MGSFQATRVLFVLKVRGAPRFPNTTRHVLTRFDTPEKIDWSFERRVQAGLRFRHAQIELEYSQEAARECDTLKTTGMSHTVRGVRCCDMPRLTHKGQRV